MAANTTPTPTITEEALALLARVAALPLDPERLPALASALEYDVRLIDLLRHVEVGELFPASMTPLTEVQPDGR